MAKRKLQDSYAQPASLSGPVAPKPQPARYQIGTAALSSKPTMKQGGPLAAYLKRTRGK